MSENGTEKPNTIWKEVSDQISDHIDLAALELRYESEQAGKRLGAMLAIGIFALTGFIVLQVAVVGLLMKVGLSLGLSSFLLSVVYFAMAYLVYLKLGRRDKRADSPFTATQREIKGTIRWIQKIFS